MSGKLERACRHCSQGQASNTRPAFSTHVPRKPEAAPRAASRLLGATTTLGGLAFRCLPWLPRELPAPLKTESGTSLKLSGNQSSASVMGEERGRWGLWLRELGSKGMAGPVLQPRASQEGRLADLKMFPEKSEVSISI